mgnify:CR=1 FL=1
MITKTLFPKGIEKQFPFKSIKGCSKINFKHKILMFPTWERKGLSDLLGNDDIISGSSTFNKSLSSVQNSIGQMEFDAIC